MRIETPSDTKRTPAQVHAWGWLRSHLGVARLSLTIALSLAAFIVAGIWYQREGYSMARALLSGWPTGTGAPVDDLPVLEIAIEPEAYQRMYRQWNESIRNGILWLDERDWVQGHIRFREQRIPVSLWLNEEEPEHWQESKWSLKVTLQDHGTILGMRSFAMQSPAVYRHLDEWLYTRDLRSAGILVPRFIFAHVWVNGDDWGVYALREGISDTFFASQQRTGGVVVRVDDSLYGRQQAWLDGALAGGGDSGERVFGGPGYAHLDQWMATEVERDSTLQEQSTAALGLLRAFQSEQLLPSQVFDTESMGRYIAHANLWGARYGTRFEEERYYYHPLASRLEPVGGESLPLEPYYAHLPSLAQYDDLEIMRAYAQEVLRISQPEYLRLLQANYERELRRYRAALQQEFAASDLAPPWQMLSERQAMLSSSLHPPETVHAYCASQESDSTVKLHVGNLLTYPVVLDRIRVGGRDVDVRADWIEGAGSVLLHQEAAPIAVLRRRQERAPRYVTIGIPRAVARELWPHGGTVCAETSESTATDTPQLVTHVYGMGESVVANVQSDYPLALSTPITPIRPSLEQAIAQHPFLIPSERAGYLELEPGDWEVAGDLILPDRYGLLASGPVTLRFDPGAILFANGPLLLHGSVDSGISMIPRNEAWGGVVVLGADGDVASSLSYVTIRGTAGIQRKGWHIPGGLTFYKSPVVLSHCQLLDTLAPNALYIVRTDFECADTEFGYASAHALRGDFVEGQVVSCSFHDVLGNALDVSGSQVDVRDLTLSRVYDHGISASKHSLVTLRGAFVGDVGTVVSSSDMSHVQMQDANIWRAWGAGLAAYTGETGYGPASIHASGIVFHDKSAVKVLSQLGSSVSLEGIAADTSEFDIQGLYWRQQVSSTIRALSYRFGPAIWLVGYNLVDRELLPGDSLQLTLYWRTHAKLDRDYTIFLHVHDASGQMIAGWDTMPRENTFPTTQWPVGTTLDDLHVVPVPEDIAPGKYQVTVGMYHWPTSERLPVYGPSGELIPGQAVSLEQTFTVVSE